VSTASARPAGEPVEPPIVERFPADSRAPLATAGADLAAADAPIGTPRRRRTRLLALAAVLLVALAAGAAVALESRAPTRKAAGTAIPPGATTTTVERRTLVERSQVDGTLAYSGALEVYDRLAGTFTWLPAVGAVVGRGGTLFRIDNLPVALMYGSVPAYRALKQGVSDGPDVAELNANLIALGFDPEAAIADGDRFGESTAAAVRRWQHAESLPETGAVELGRVVFALGARRITAVRVALGDDPPPASSNKPAAKAPTHKHKSKENTAKEPAKEKGKEKEKASSEPEAAAAAPKPVLGTTSSQQIVQLQVKANQQQLAHVGEAAPVTLPDGRIAQAHITSVGTVATEESEKEKGGGGSEKPGNGENATVAVTLALDHPVARLDKAPVSVELVKSIRRDVLAVSATALVATAGGGYAIEALEGTRRVELAVTPGMFANGYVEIEGAGVHEGLTVTEPQ
jgi:hypothetical protein